MAGRQCDASKKKTGIVTSASRSVAKPRTSRSATHPEFNGSKSSTEGGTQFSAKERDSARKPHSSEKLKQSESGSGYGATLPETPQAAPTLPEGVKIRQKAAERIRARVDAIKSVQDIEQLARMSWHEEAFRVTKFVSPSRMNRNRFRIFIIEVDNQEDEEFFSSLSLGPHETDLLKRVNPGAAICIASKYSEGAIEKNTALRHVPMLSVILGKVKPGGDVVHQTARMLEKMRRRLVESIARMDGETPSSTKLESVAVRLPSIVDVFVGRKIAECAWRGLGIKVEFCAKPKEERGFAPKSRLCYMIIRTEAVNSLLFQQIYDKLKDNVRPSVHGVEVHKVAHLANGSIRLRIKEIRPGGRETYAEQVCDKLGFSVYFT